jgi:transcription-repair coupling factor (superfamily II helicase)
MDTLTPGIGDNNPPDAIALLIADLNDTHTPLIERADALLGMRERLPEACEDDDTAVKLTDAIKSCTAFTKNSEAARVSAKEPHQAAGRAVDGFFKKLSDPVDALKVKMSNLLTAFQRKKADEERRQREAAAAEAKRIADAEAAAAREAQRAAREAEAAAREAERLAAEAVTKAQRDAANAARAKADADAEAAREAKDKAAVAKQDAAVSRSDATVKAAELTRSRSDLGAVASLRTTWAFELVDLAEVPRNYLSLNEGAVRAQIKAATTRDGKCPLKIPGIRIYEKQESVVR